MSFEVDEDILQDFLIEAGEILEQLSEQLVELERSPDDSDLLNAIFRGFHTVKGGAGFLSLTDLVDVCHGAENVFDVLRNGQLEVSAELMDVILEALDTVNEMFQAVQDREPFDPAPPELLESLHRLCEGPSAEPEPEPEPEPVVEAPAPAVEAVADATSVISGGSIDEITDDEFDKLLDELHGVGNGPAAQSKTVEQAVENVQQGANVVEQIATGSGDITDDEFEKLLDELHGSGNSPSNTDFEIKEPTKVESAAPTPAPQVAQASNGDLMTDDEFEKLLDELHGSGHGPTSDELEAAVKPVAETVKEANGAAPKATAAPQEPAPVAKPAPKQPAAAKKAPARAAKKPAASKPQVEATLRVDTSTLDTIMNMVGELVLVRNRLVSLGLNNEDEEISKAVSNLDVVTGDLQGAVMKTRMQPVKKVFGKFPRVVRDLARSLKKEIVLETEGEETDLDKNLIEALADPMVHLVRNSVDHGIEMPDERVKEGKSRTGTVTLSASQEGDHILLTIADDGKGMDAEKLRGIAVDKGIMDTEAAKRLSDKEAFNLIFAPGFSTKKEISDISGRGVGMDVVKTGISSLNGTIDIDSKLGKGTVITIKVPLTMAILPTMMVGIGTQPFALPLASVNEIINLDLSKTNVVDGQLTLIVREKSIPLFYLQDWLRNVNGIELTRGQRDKGHVVIVQIGHQMIGFVVDSLIGQEEVVIKPLDQLLQGTPGMAGATITSDGKIALILDVPGLLKRYA